MCCGDWAAQSCGSYSDWSRTAQAARARAEILPERRAAKASAGAGAGTGEAHDTGEVEKAELAGDQGEDAGEGD